MIKSTKQIKFPKELVHLLISRTLTQLLLLNPLPRLSLAKAPIMQMQLSAWQFVSHAQAVGASRSGEDHEIDNEVAIDRSKEPPNCANDLINKVEVCDKT